MINITRTDLPPLAKYIVYLNKIWKNHQLTNDSHFTRLLEKRLEGYLKVNNLLLTSNGTSALRLSLKALDIKGEVITTPFTFPATVNTLLLENLIPVFADINPETFNIDPVDIERRITRNTTAILAVHIYGNPSHAEKIKKTADRYKLKLIFDGAHAFGVEYKNKSIFSYGDISTVSLHATKVFSTGEGGAIIARDKNLYNRLRLLRNHGIKSETEVIMPGMNAKMNEFQAALGLCNLKDIDRKIQLRKELYEHYKNKLSKLNIQFQKIIASRYNYAYMPICLDSKKNREKVYRGLLRNGIKARRYFYPLIPSFKYIQDVEEKSLRRKNFDVASDIASRVLCIPLFPDLKINTINKITEIIRSCLI